jgi:6-hydroxymethylpterin diphosphokinase MptE-like
MKVPYPMTAAMSFEQRHVQMGVAIATNLPRLERVPIDDSKSISIAAYGPSLRDTWRDLTPPILSMSGSTHFLAERGIIPDYHIDMDPRSHKAKHIDPPVPGVHYLMASVCPSDTWTILRGERVTLWHAYSGKNDQGFSTWDWVRQHDPGHVHAVVHGGSTIGLTAIHLAGLLGFRHFEIHGMDGSYADASRTSRHAGVHYGHAQKGHITWDAEGVTYHTSRIMANAVAETINVVRNFPVFCVFHGHGLTQALVREANVDNACTADQTEKAARIRRAGFERVALPRLEAGMRSPWDAFLARPDPAWLSELLAAFKRNERRRAVARYNTGSIGLEAALQLRAVCCSYEPKTIIEIGTFIGNSTAALKATGQIFTCDRDNDCVPSSDRVICFPYQTSTQMLTVLADRGVSADLVFLDGRIQPADVPLLQRVTHDRTVWVFDDYVGHEKGVVNVGIMRPLLPRHTLLQPYRDFATRSTLAALLPLTVR